MTAQEPGRTRHVTWPGLIDLQVNGYGGLDLNAHDADAGLVIALTKSLWAEGTTTFLPTLVTAPESQILSTLSAIAQARRQDPLVAHSIPGVHIEGPALNADDGPRGAHDRRHLRDPDLNELDRWQEACDGLVRIVTLAPERDGALEFIRGAAARGVRTSIGHCAPTPGQVREAAEAGATLSTHLGNGTYPLLPRHPNHLWAQLAEDRLTAMVIPDGHHLPADVLTVFLRANAPDRCVLTSDSVALAGAEPGEYRTPVGGSVTVSGDGRLTLTGTELLAGSGRSLRGCLDWAREHLPFGEDELVAMATHRPATLLNLDERAGPHGDRLLLDIDHTGSRVRAVDVAGTRVVEN
ncbi:N-acetylglucosamine-6-phosphate deacetylase [Ruania halotolerans]|uniref:N-acetylglucosamine-6-phosphate deacetylase n=1 Tax=Ruania halotolerans TaxID=2897773 RepID=UPI001E48E8EA|nr:amidohydrolase family protein [Ruania halotolerans]UFU06888.1 amidohydrolase family protein [Ruania halotolerans]